MSDTKELIEDARSGIGWFEFITPDNAATTHIAYVTESGHIYLPDPNVSREAFRLAAATDRFWKLSRSADLADSLEAQAAEITALRAIIRERGME